MSTTKQVFTGDKSQLEAAYRSLATEVTRLEGRVQQLANTSEQGSRLATRGQEQSNLTLAAAADRVASVASAYFGLNAIAQSYNETLQRQIQLERDAAGAQQKLAAGQAEIILNTFGMDEATQRRIAAEAQKMAVRYGIDEQLATQTAGRLMGAGTGPVEQRLEALDIAMQLSRHDAASMLMPTALAIQQAQKVTGMSSEQAAALMASGGSAAFIGDPAMQARFLQQVMSGVVASSRGDPRLAAEQGIELGAWLTQAVGEERGESARTAGTSLAAQLDEFFTRGYEIDAGGRKARIVPPDDPLLPIDRFRRLQENPALGRQFLKGASFERLFESTIRRAIEEPQGDAARLLAQTESVVSVDVAASREQRQRLADMSEQIVQSNLAAQGKAITQEFKSSLTREAVTANLREFRDTAETAAAPFRHLTPPEAFLINKVRDFGGFVHDQEPEYLLGDLKSLRREVLQGTRLFPTTPDKLAGDERKVFDLLTKLIDNGERQLQELEKLNRKPEGHHLRQSLAPAAALEAGRHRER